MSGKKQAAKAVVAAPVNVAKKTAEQKIKRDANGNKIMKVAHGTERARRRADLIRNWRTTKGAKQMLPVKGAEQVAQ